MARNRPDVGRLATLFGARSGLARPLVARPLVARPLVARPLVAPSLLTLSTLAASLLTPARVAAQTEPVEYSAKFVCGQRAATTGAGASDAVSPGVYFTAINVRNTSRDTIRVRTRVATTLAAPTAGQLLPGPGLLLGPEQALEIDCAEILRVGERQRFLKGFLLLTSPAELDVVAVYTAGRSAAVETMDVESVPARRPSLRQTADACPDLTIGRVERPTYTTDRRTRVRVVVANIGDAAAENIVVYMEDPAGAGPERIVTATVPSLAAGETTVVTLEFTYEVSGNARVAAIALIVDPKNLIAECREDNNRKTLGAP